MDQTISQADHVITTTRHDANRMAIIDITVFLS
jgi:hypothetical protein